MDNPDFGAVARRDDRPCGDCRLAESVDAAPDDDARLAPDRESPEEVPRVLEHAVRPVHRIRARKVSPDDTTRLEDRDRFFHRDIPRSWQLGTPISRSIRVSPFPGRQHSPHGTSFRPLSRYRTFRTRMLPVYR